MKLSAGSFRIGGSLILYDENGVAIALMADSLKDKERIALEIVRIVNEAHDAAPRYGEPTKGEREHGKG
jgi:hypothetical protein